MAAFVGFARRKVRAVNRTVAFAVGGLAMATETAAVGVAES